MTRIFSTLAVLSNALLAYALWLGLSIGDARLREAAVQQRVGVHFLVSVGAIVFAVLVHALVLTYFMGTGRWLEETLNAYRLPPAPKQASRELKWRAYPVMIFSLLLLILTGAFGGAADPASTVGFQGWGGLSAAQVHLVVASVTVAFNVIANVWEFVALHRNGQLVNGVMHEVRRIRAERGLDAPRQPISGTPASTGRAAP